MAVTSAAESTPALPDYLASPNAVFADEDVQWRYGRAPDYSKTRKVWEEGTLRVHIPKPRGSHCATTSLQKPHVEVTTLWDNVTQSTTTTKRTRTSPLTLSHRQEVGSCHRKPATACGEPRQELGSRGFLQATTARLANHRSRELLFRNERRASTIRRAYAEGRHVQRYHRA